MEFLNESDLKDIAEEVVERSPQEGEDSDIERDLEDWVEDDEIVVKSLFNEDTLKSVEELILHDKEIFGFDLREQVKAHCTDELSIIRLINFVRSETAAAPAVDSNFIDSLVIKIGTKEFASDDKYMVPVIEDDPLLFSFEESLMPSTGDEDGEN